MKIRLFTFTSFLFLVLTGCVNINSVSPLDEDEKIDNRSGYIFGGFHLNRRKSINLSSNWLVLENTATKKTMSIPFEDDEDDSFFAITLAPGNYRVVKVLHAGLAPEFMLTKYDVFDIPIPFKYSYITEPFEVKNNQSYYIGDFYSTAATVEQKVKPVFLALEVTTYFDHSFNDVQHDFENAKLKFNEKYPELRSLKTSSVFVDNANKLFKRDK